MGGTTSNGVFNENENKKMTKKPKLKWGDRMAARVDEVGYLIDIRLVGYTGIRDVLIAEVHESVADEVNAWCLPEGLKSASSYDVFAKNPRAGAYYKYIRLKDIVHEES